MALDSAGNPHIAYYSGQNVGHLVYASLTSNGWAITDVDSDNFWVGLSPSLAIDDAGHPHISYYELIGQTSIINPDPAELSNLKYAVCTSADCTDSANWTDTVVDRNGDVGSMSSLAVDSAGISHIAYYDSTNPALKYASRQDDVWNTTTVDNDGFVGAFPSLALDSAGNPHIAYEDVGSQDLKYASWTGSKWTFLTVDRPGNVGRFASLALDSSDLPHMSYVDVSNGTLKYAGLVDDSTAPVTTATATTADTNPYTFGDWTNQSVSVTLSADDGGGSGVANTYYSLNNGTAQLYTSGTPISIVVTGSTTLDYWSTDVAANEETHHSVTIQIETSIPTISGAPTTGPNGAGWYHAPVTIHWTCDDTGGSGVATCPADQAINTEGQNQTIGGTVTDNAGNSATATSDPPVNIDLTAPTIIYSGNQGSYTIDQTVNITCQAADTLSGVATTDCADITGSAASFVIGANTITNTATDNAGNTGSNSATFTVGVSYDSLCHLTEQYTSNRRTASRLCSPLHLAAMGQQMRNSRMERAGINSYIMLVNMQRGRGLTTQEVNALIGFARSL